jgi:hypothetical protein
MNRIVKRILGINPGTRYLGLAVFHDTELLDWRVKTFSGKWINEKAKRIIETIIEYIELYDINVISLKRLHPARSSNNLKFLVSKIKILATRKKVKVNQNSIKDIERFFLNDEKPNRRNLAEKIIGEYPMLIHELNRVKPRKYSYHMRAIEAVALGCMKNKQTILDL